MLQNEVLSFHALTSFTGHGRQRDGEECAATWSGAGRWPVETAATPAASSVSIGVYTWWRSRAPDRLRAFAMRSSDQDSGALVE